MCCERLTCGSSIATTNTTTKAKKDNPVFASLNIETREHKYKRSFSKMGGKVLLIDHKGKSKYCNDLSIKMIISFFLDKSCYNSDKIHNQTLVAKKV